MEWDYITEISVQDCKNIIHNSMFINRKLYFISLDSLSTFILNPVCEVWHIFGLTTPVNTSVLILKR